MSISYTLGDYRFTLEPTQRWHCWPEPRTWLSGAFVKDQSVAAQDGVVMRSLSSALVVECIALETADPDIKTQANRVQIRLAFRGLLIAVVQSPC